MLLPDLLWRPNPFFIGVGILTRVTEQAYGVASASRDSWWPSSLSTASCSSTASPPPTAPWPEGWPPAGRSVMPRLYRRR